MSHEALSQQQFGDYTIEVHREPQTHWGLPALHVRTKHEGKTIGGLSVFQRLHDGDQEPRAHPNIWVNEEHQRRGVATAMYAEVGRHWPSVPIEHSPHASPAAKALNKTLGGNF